MRTMWTSERLDTLVSATHISLIDFFFFNATIKHNNGDVVKRKRYNCDIDSYYQGMISYLICGFVVNVQE